MASPAVQRGAGRATLPVPGPMERAALVQHLMGIGLVVAGYAFLARRGVRPWIAALAVVPVAADDLQLTMEHFVASDTMFTALLAAGLLVLLWRPGVPVAAAVVGGLLLAIAALTRTIGQPLIVLCSATCSSCSCSGR